MQDTVQREFAMETCLGRGGFGEVYLARVQSSGGLQSRMAVKILRADLDVEADAVRRLRDEGRLLARLRHPAILKVFDLVRLDGRVALVAEYVEGADLEELVSDRLPPRALLQVIGRVAGALHAAWSTPGPDGAPLHLVHRDIKPTNIRVGRHGEIKLLDFGIAHFQGDDREAETASHVIVGSMPYMAPERFTVREVAPSSDIFSLGCTLYEGLAGTPFYDEGHLRKMTALALDDELYDEHLDERLALLPDLPDAAEALLREVLSFEPDARPTAEELTAACADLADTLGGPTLRRFCRSRTWSPPPAVEDAPLTGRTLREAPLEMEPAEDHASPDLHVLHAPRTTLPPTPPDPTPASPVRARSSTTRRLAGCGAAMLAIGLMVSGLLVLAAWLALLAAS